MARVLRDCNSSIASSPSVSSSVFSSPEKPAAALNETPRPCRKSLRQIARRLQGVDGENLPTELDVDESLAQAASSLEISCDVGAECSTGGDMSSCAQYSLPSPSWSPATVDGKPNRHSKRRSISELSHSARMTPKALQNRGLGIPWQSSAGGGGLCSTLDVREDQAVVERALQLCLVPTPELMRQGCRPTPPGTPELHSPGARQRLFQEQVRRASGPASPALASGRGGSSGSSAGALALGYALAPALPGSCPTTPARDSGKDWRCMLSPISPLPLDTDGEESVAMAASPAPPSSAASPDVRLFSPIAAPPYLHTARRMTEERLQLGGCRVQPEIQKLRRATPRGGAGGPMHMAAVGASSARSPMGRAPSASVSSVRELWESRCRRNPPPQGQRRSPVAAPGLRRERQALATAVAAAATRAAAGPCSA